MLPGCPLKFLGSGTGNGEEDAHLGDSQRGTAAHAVFGNADPRVGKVGTVYYDFARGIDTRPVEAVRIRKSVGCEHTLEKDISKRSSVIIELYHAAVELVGRLEHANFRGNTLTLKIKFHDFSQITRSMTQTKELVALT